MASSSSASAKSVQQRSFTSTRRSNSSSRNNNKVDPLWLAQDWADDLLSLEEKKVGGGGDVTSPGVAKKNQIIQATARSIPLLNEASAVPFVCRYRTDLIDPLTTGQVQLLWNLLDKHAALDSLRNKLLQVVGASDAAASDDEQRLRRIQTSTSKAELEDWYAPYKPPSKGSILERIQKEHPELVAQVDALWTKTTTGQGDDRSPPPPHPNRLHPREALLHLLATKIAAEPVIGDVVRHELEKHCRIQTKLLVPSNSASAAASRSNSNNSRSNSHQDGSKYRHYQDFSQRLVHLRDHQVLAIRRGVAGDHKCLQLSYQVDATKMEGCIRYHLLQNNTTTTNLLPAALRQHGAWRRLILDEAVHVAWTKFLRRRGTSRLWNDKCRAAQERAMQVFCQNVHHALLVPPYYVPSQRQSDDEDDPNNRLVSSTLAPPHLLALDPGFQAGIKCAVLDPAGQVLQLETVKFLGSDSKREHALKQLGQLLRSVVAKQTTKKNAAAKTTSSSGPVVVVALGNGHGSQEARTLIQQASNNYKIPIDLQLVNEAGASVWSVTPAAKAEFPAEPAAAIAAISIGRRLQNPLHELIKVPPKSLGLGMYQHDLSEKELEDKLRLTSIDAVAAVGVEVNHCSLEILQKVPGLDAKLAAKIIQQRPLRQRQNLLNVPGLGPKKFENCAAFLRIQDSAEELDRTLVHPESYEMARWLLKQLHWKLSSDATPKDIPPRKEWGDKWETLLNEASEKFHVSPGRVLAVLENLIDSMTQIDPRLRTRDELSGSTAVVSTTAGSVDSCTILPGELTELAALQKACPVRGVIGTVRTVTDFGAFVDFGAMGDGLLHTSKLGPVPLETLLIGEQIGVDILSVVDNKKVSLGLTGLDLQADVRSVPRRRPGAAVPGGGRQRRGLATSSRPRNKKAKTPTNGSKAKRTRSDDIADSRSAKKRKRG